MSNFQNNAITINGAVAIAALIAGGTLTFTRIAVGDGELPASSTAMMREDLVHKLFDVDIHEVYYDSESQATIKGVFNNAAVETGFYYRELGLFAIDPVTKREILFCYGNAGSQAEWINAAGDGSIIEKEVHIVTLVGNATEVTATMKSGIYPTREQVNAALSLKADLDTTAAEGGRVVASQMRFDASQTLYVDAAATEEGADGTEAKPFKTIQAAINARYMGAPVVYIKIKPGTYAEDIQTPRSPGTTWRFERNGEGVVSVRNAIFDNAAYLYANGLTFVGPAGSNSTIVYVANTPSVYFTGVKIDGASTSTGVNLSTSRGVFQGVTVNNCGIGIAATSGAYLDLRSTSGTSNIKGLHADGAIIVCDWYVPSATTPYETVNGGAINVQGGASSFPSNFSQRNNLGDFTDLASLKSAILAEHGRLGVGESRACWFANNIPSGFGIFGTGQRMVCDITKTTDYNGGFGIVIFYSHHYSPCGFMRIQNGAFTSDSPIAFMTQEGGTFTGEISLPIGVRLTLGQAFLRGVNSDGYKGLDVYADETGNSSGVYIRASNSTNEAGWIHLQSRNGQQSSTLVLKPNGELTWKDKLVPLLASNETEVMSESAGVTVDVPLLYELGDFRRIGKYYAVGDRVACAFQYDLFLECTKAGTTSTSTLDTREVTFGQVITDGTCQWTVRAHVKSVSGGVADASGNVTIQVIGNDAIDKIVEE